MEVAIKNHKCKVSGGIIEDVPILQCSHEEAEDRIMYHINSDVRLYGFRRVFVASRDTDAFIILMYHFKMWRKHGVNEIWAIHNDQISPIHEAVDNLDPNIVNILLAIHALSGCDTTRSEQKIHALSGCDTTSKVGTKNTCTVGGVTLQVMSEQKMHALSGCDTTSKVGTKNTCTVGGVTLQVRSEQKMHALSGCDTTSKVGTKNTCIVGV